MGGQGGRVDEVLAGKRAHEGFPKKRPAPKVIPEDRLLGSQKIAVQKHAHTKDNRHNNRH